MDPVRRKVLKTGAAVTAMAAARSVFGQQTGKGTRGITVGSAKDGSIKYFIPDPDLAQAT